MTASLNALVSAGAKGFDQIDRNRIHTVLSVDHQGAQKQRAARLSQWQFALPLPRWVQWERTGEKRPGKPRASLRSRPLKTLRQAVYAKILQVL